MKIYSQKSVGDGMKKVIKQKKKFVRVEDQFDEIQESSIVKKKKKLFLTSSRLSIWRVRIWRKVIADFN